MLAVEGNSVMWCWVQWVGPSGILTTRFCCTTHTSHCLLQRVELHRDDSLTHTYEWPFWAKRWPSAQQAMAIISHILKLLQGFWKQCNILLMNCEFFMSTRHININELMNNLNITSNYKQWTVWLINQWVLEKSCCHLQEHPHISKQLLPTNKRDLISKMN